MEPGPPVIAFRKTSLPRRFTRTGQPGYGLAAGLEESEVRHQGFRMRNELTGVQGMVTSHATVTRGGEGRDRSVRLRHR